VLTRYNLLSLLDDIEHKHEEAASLYLPPGIELDTYLQKISGLLPVKQEISKNISTSQTGAAILWGQSYKLIILPPFSLKDKYMTLGYDIEPLRSLLKPDHKIGIVLVRLGSYSIGISEGEKLIVHKTGTGLVHGRQRQGGSSAARFQRRRQDQAHHFLKRVSEHAREIIEAYGNKLDYFVYGGARTTIQQLRKQSAYFDKFDDRLLPPLLDIPDPRFNVLENAVSRVWSSRIVEWSEEPDFKL
jgi:hypothetical protein